MRQRRKTRCSGTWPCVFCSNNKFACSFTAPYRRGQIPVVVADVGGSESLSNRAEQTDATDQAGPRTVHEDTGPRQRRMRTRTRSLDGDGRRTSFSDAASQSPAPAPPPAANRQGMTSEDPARLRNARLHDRDQRESPEASQTDEQGHYVGPASGVSFLLRIQKKLQVHSPGYRASTSIFNFGDRPLALRQGGSHHEGGPSFAILPPKDRAEAMLARYFDFAATTHRFLHRPSVEAWLRELYETDGAMRDQHAARSRVALLFMIFAHSNNYRSRSAADDKESMADAAETRYASLPEYRNYYRHHVLMVLLLV